MPAGFLKLKNPEPSLLLDLKTWQDYYDWDKQSVFVPGIEIDIDPESLEISFSSPEPLPDDVGPFKNYKGITNVSIDPRR